jgi:hypothetical protein
MVLQTGATGGATNPMLTLTNTNAGATGAVAMEVYKNKPTAGVAGEVLFNQSVYGNDSLNNKQEYTRIAHTIRDSAIAGEDGSIEFGCFTAGTFANFLQINGVENEVNCLKTLDMGGNAIRSNLGSLVIETTNSSGNGNITLNANGTNAVGDITITAKNNMVLTCGAAPDTIDLQGGVKLTNGRQITFTNASNSDTGIAQSQAFTITDGIETGSITKDSVVITNATNTNTTTILKDTIDLINNTGATNDSASLGLAGFSSVRVSGPNQQNFSFDNNSASGGTIDYTNTIGSNGILIKSNQSVSLESTTGLFFLTNLPTSIGGLPTGALWNNGGVLNIV